MIALIGDGAMQYTTSALWTAVRHLGAGEPVVSAGGSPPGGEPPMSFPCARTL
ncbi:hypothetical protein ABT126_28400 [Streptomyces sp. NPDC002012]|uniref:hypothetical protein n=1 Tax=Streptomyces sp. NPDC002012 TaxID=3154532 RepID=UPI003323DE5E